MEGKINKDEVAKLLAAGMSETTVANICGCDPSYISQLKTDPAFADKMQSLRMSKFASQVDNDGKLGDARTKIVNKLLEAVDNVYKPMEVMALFRTINEAKLWTGVGEVKPEETRVVPIALPPVVQVHLQFNNNNEIVVADGRVLQNLPAQVIGNMLDSRRITNANKQETTAALPPTKRTEETNSSNQGQIGETSSSDVWAIALSAVGGIPAAESTGEFTGDEFPKVVSKNTAKGIGGTNESR